MPIEEPPESEPIKAISNVSSAVVRLPGGPAVAIITPTLILLGISITSVFILALGIVLVSFITRQLVVSKTKYQIDDAFVFVVTLSTAALITGVLSFGAGILFLVCLALIAAIGGLRRGSRPRTEGFLQQEDQLRSELVSGGLLLFPFLLAVLGWQSLGFFAVGLVSCRTLLRRMHGSTWSWLPVLLVPTGFLFSMIARDRSEGQFWVSADQLWRSSIASGIPRWGYRDFSGSAGGILRFHWLGEGTAGLLARYIGTSAVESTTVVLPALGVLVSFIALRRIGVQLGFNVQNSATAGASTIVLCREFDIFSLGSLWGISLFLVGLSTLCSLVSDNPTIMEPYGVREFVIVLLAPIITLSQSTLGLNFVLLTFFVAVIWTVIHRSRATRWAVMLCAQIVALVILRSTLLASESTDMFAPSISLNSFLQFRGLNVYLGENSLYVAGVSILFLLLVSQKGAGFILLGRRIARDSGFRFLLGATAASSLFLSNVITMGGSEAQQSRFLSPLVVVVVFISCLGFYNELSAKTTAIRSKTHVCTAILLVLFGTLVAIWGMHWLYSSGWSRERSLGISLAIVAVQFLMAGTWWYWWRSRLLSSIHGLFATLLVGGLVVLASSNTISNLVDFQITATDQRRADEFTGGNGAQECFREIRNQTPRDAIIATNWFRLPPPSRQPKNFIVSAWTERRVYLDGPEYIRYYVDAPPVNLDPPSDWVDLRYQATDDFAERATETSYELLRAAEVQYFVVEAGMPMPKTWEPFAEVVFERAPCKVLKLRT